MVTTECACVYVSHLSRVGLFATSWTAGHQAPSSVHGISQARIMEWVAVLSSRGSSQPRDQIYVSYISWACRWILYHLGHLESPPQQGKRVQIGTTLAELDLS